MLSQIDQKKIKLKLKSIYRYHLSEIDINGCCEEITKVINKFNKIGEKIGLLFQISDDLIDYSGNSKIAGKKTRKDEAKGKATLISLLGYKNTIKYSKKLKQNIFNELAKYQNRSNNLRETIEFILNRTN